MKWILIGILFIACVTIGYIFSIRYKKRVAFFSALILLAQKLDVEINFSRERLKKLIESSDEKMKSNLLGIDKSFIQYLESGGELNSTRLFEKCSLIKNDEKEIITIFFKNLGRSDVENQTKEIKNSIIRFEKLLNESSAENKKYGKLGIKLGIIAGLAMIVILI